MASLVDASIWSIALAASGAARSCSATWFAPRPPAAPLYLTLVFFAAALPRGVARPDASAPLERFAARPEEGPAPFPESRCVAVSGSVPTDFGALLSPHS